MIYDKLLLINTSFIINIFNLSRMSNKLFLVLLAGLIINTVSFSMTPKTAESLSKSLNKYDKNHDNVLSKTQARKYFDEEYMSDFAGIDIDPKFIESAWSHLLKGDKDSDGFLNEEEFIAILIPKQETNTSREPTYYAEQDL